MSCLTLSDTISAFNVALVVTLASGKTLASSFHGQGFESRSSAVGNGRENGSKAEDYF